jgi:hypothetical protein
LENIEENGKKIMENTEEKSVEVIKYEKYGRNPS